MKTPRVYAALVPLVFLAACGTQRGADPGAGTVAPALPVAGTDWTVGAVTVDGARSVAPPGARVAFTADGRVRGSSGCNAFGAAVTVSGDSLTVAPSEVTAMGCPADQARFEAAFLKAFSGELKGGLKGTALTLTSPDGRRGVELTAEPDAPLTGTAWTVDALLSGKTAASLPAGAAGKAVLTFGKDGRLTGSLGCNRVTAPAEIDTKAKTITLGALATTRMICTGPQMDLETRMYEALDGPLRYRLEHRTLTVTDADGQGFTATAAQAP
ncbi:META domain-containing protein [Streptomyces sp. NPDC048659]|uniref:META domain-containing protein n=1 Tax=Streptomyces sp. NPDC048659 TaxID=3155489 RepID=UPI00341E2F45